MKKIFKYALIALVLTSTAYACKTSKDSKTNGKSFNVMVDRFADLQVLRYNVPGFEELPLKQKLFIYHLSEAALAGRDITYDQNYKHNLRIRKTLEEIYTHYKGNRKSSAFLLFGVYAKRVWFSNGIHHHYAETKLVPDFTAENLTSFMRNSPDAQWPLMEGQDLDAFIAWLKPILFDPKVDAKRVNKSSGIDKITNSAGNLYEGVTEKEVTDFYNRIPNSNAEPISLGLNSKLVKENGKLVEKIWKVGGMYSASISKIVSHLQAALPYAENDPQRYSLIKLIAYYKDGSLKTWDDYNVAWVKDTKAKVDLINGFIEVYHDPIGMRATYESCVQVDDKEASERMSTVSENAQWFEDNSPIAANFKKKEVKGITYKVVNVAMEAGALAPSTAIGINLPNANWIRTNHGSKSVSLGNILAAYDASSAGGLTGEFAYTATEAERAKQYGSIAGKMHTALHEVIGHASGKMNPGITKKNMGEYGSTLEEARADLVALYYIYDQKMVDLGLMPSLDVGKTEYDGYIRNGLMTQMRRLTAGADIEEDHMRNRQMVAKWVYEKGQAEKVIEKKIKDGKTFFVVNDYSKLRVLFGQLLAEIQRIKSEGDFEAGKAMVENYGVKVDPELHKEVLERVGKLKLAAYSGFVQPKLELVKDANGKARDVKITYKEGFAEQMLRYGKDYATLPYTN
jgi:dipeptidyl-peptidase-3